MESRPEVSGGLVIPCGNGTEAFDPAEEVLDQMPRLIERFVVFSRDQPVPL
jgi:hypothetical protein